MSSSGSSNRRIGGNLGGADAGWNHGIIADGGGGGEEGEGCNEPRRGGGS